MKTLLAASLLAMTGAACGDASLKAAEDTCPRPSAPYQSPTSAPAGTGDDHLTEVGREVPEFAGIYVDPKTQSWVVLVTDGSQVTATRAKIAYERRTGASRDVSIATYSPVPRPQRAKYSWIQLASWYGPAQHEIYAAMDVRMTDIDEVGNTLRFGVADPQQNRACVDAAMRRLGIPEDAYLIEHQAPISLL